MTWRERLQPASLGGVPFEVDTSTASLGRRVVVHEYPGNDEHWVEDLGAGGDAKPLRVQGFVIGDNYDQRRDALIEITNKEEAVTLIHPRWGAVDVKATAESTVSETTREGGIATFSLVLVRVGVRKFPATQADSVAAVEGAVNGGLSALQSDFTERFTVAGLAGWVADSATEWLNTGFDALQPFADAANTASSITATFDQLRNQFTNLLATPGDLAEQTLFALRSLFEINASADNDAATPIAIRRQLTDTLNGIVAIPTTTPTRQQQAANRSAVIDLLSGAASLLAAQTIAQLSRSVDATVEQSPFTSYDHAIAVRDDLIAELDTLADTASDPVFEAIRSLKPELVRHINTHGFSLARLGSYTPQTELPAVVLAHSLYGSADREADIIERNNVRHPAFVPAGYPLEILAEAV